MKNKIMMFIVLMLVSNSLNAMKFSNTEDLKVDIRKKEAIIKIMDLKIDNLTKIKECIGQAKTENDIANCSLQKARRENVMNKEIKEIKSKTPGTFSY